MNKPAKQFSVSKRWGTLLRPLAISLGLLAAVAVSAAPSNPITVENGLPGDASWQLVNPAFNQEIQGYASATSVQAGDTLKISAAAAADPQSSLTIYRIGWYGSVGARNVFGPVTVSTPPQALGTPSSATGLLDANWPVVASVKIPGRSPAAKPWTSGFYLIKLTGLTSGYQCYVPFVVREPNRSSQLLLNSGVLTYQAYNFTGGSCLYSTPPGVYVSFNRPYQRSYGGGDFLNWEIQMVRFLEREGYDVTYQTDIDLHHGRNFFAFHNAMIFVGHDEYWTYEMRQNVEIAKLLGEGIGNFAANTCFWQVRLAPDAAGNPDRTVIGYKYTADTSDPYAAIKDAYHQARITTQWRDPVLNRPEGMLFGTQYIGDPFYGDMTVSNASSWVFKNAGVTNGSVLTGLAGYEVDGVIAGSSPSGVTTLTTTVTPYGNSSMAYYTGPSGGTIFSTGSMQWSWGLDSYGTAWLWPQPNYVSPAAQQITRNVLYKLITRKNP